MVLVSMKPEVVQERNWILVIVLACLLWTGFFGVAWAKVYMVPMRDGARLATDIYLPEGDGPWPTILVRTPYGRGNEAHFNNWGYAVVSQDLRGFGSSEGVMMPFESDGWGELQDGYDTVEWIASQNWSNGKIGTWGASYLGAVQNLMAGSYPPHLICQHITVAPSDQYSQDFFPGGVYTKADKKWFYGSWATPEALERVLPHSNYDSYWELQNSETRVGGMIYPGFHIGGWYDCYTQGTINAFVERQYKGGPGSAGNQRLVIGPWAHMEAYRQQDPSDTRKFFDYWLKGIDDGFTDMPTVRYYVIGDVDDPNAPGNEWRSADDWPIPYGNFSLYLSENELQGEPGPDSSTSYSYDPKNPAPTIGGGVLHIPAGPLDQRPAEERDDVLVYTSEPLTVPVEVTGKIYLQLFASSSCPDTDFMVKLTDVYPGGQSIWVADGAIGARHRNSMEAEEFMVPGEVYEFWIDLWSTSIVFNKGHRIRVTVTSSSDPWFDPNPNTGHPFRADSETRIADNTIHMGTTYPTRIILPLTGPDNDGDGVYDILDPLPNEAGPHSKEDIAGLMQETNQLIASLNDQKLQSVLEEASQSAKTLLAEGDLIGPGHLLLMIDEPLMYDTSGISLPEAQKIVDGAMDLAMESAKEAKYSNMLHYLKAGWRLGTIREECENLGGSQLLVQHLLEAEELMNRGLPVEAARIADWCSKPSGQLLAKDIQGYEDSWQEIASVVSERDLKILEGLLMAAKKEFIDIEEEACLARLTTMKQKLDQLGIQIPEPILLSILWLVLLPVMLRRR